MNIYIVLTPYHLFLSLIHAERKEDDLVVLIDDNGQLGKYEIVGSKLFCFFIYINRSSVMNKYLSRQLLFNAGNKISLDDIVLIARNRECDKVFAFNDANAAAQYLLRKIKLFTSCKVCYIEDGAAPYNNHNIKWSFMHKVKCWIAYGLRYEFVSVLGTSKLIDGSLFLYPELVRIENKIKPFSEFNIDINCNYKINELADLLDLVEYFQFKKTVSVLFLLPREFNNNHKLSGLICDYIIKLNSFGVEVFVKHHPLDKYFFDFPIDCKVISSFVPAEIIPSKYSNLKVVFGFDTTSLMAVKKIYPDIISCNIKLDNNKNSYHDVMVSSGVVMISDNNLNEVVLQYEI